MSVVVAFARGSTHPLDAAWLHGALRAVAAAGPDAQRAWVGEGVGLGHALLHDSIDAPSQQPLTVGGDVWLSADARLDDRGALIDALRASGHPVPADADDARLVLHAYLAWGAACVDRLAGDFAFVVWDGRVGRLFAARDQMGVVPLYYAADGERLCLSGALDALRLRDDVPDTLDERTVGDFLVAGFPLDRSATFYAAIRQLPPAHALVWEAGRVTVRRYWFPPVWEGFARLTHAADYATRFRDLLREAVADRTRCRHVGVQLSGGLDSTSVAALAHDISRSAATPFAMRAYTAAVDAVMPDREREYASLVAEHLGIAAELIDISACPDVDPLGEPGVLLPQPSLFRRTTLELDFVRRPAAHGRVVLSGLGSDVLLAVTPSCMLDWLAGGQVRRVAGAVTEHVRLFGRPPVPGLRSALRHVARRRRDDGAPIAPWIDASFARRTALDERRRASQRAVKDLDDAHGLATWPYWADLLAHGHPGYTGAPVRFRHPFFDLRLLRFVVSLPPRPWLVEKRILREATRDLLPEAVRRRPKTALAAATSQALRDGRGEMTRLAALVDSAPELDRFVDRRRLRATVVGTGTFDRRQQRAHLAALGLAHWLQHRRRPSWALADSRRSAPTSIGSAAATRS